MKAKYSIGIISAFLLLIPALNAQTTANRDFRNSDAGVVVNNYYNDYDYYYSSRINRFHRSYSAFNYYSPIFTDTYFYNYQPFSCGLSIYGGRGPRLSFGLGFSYNYPFYNYGYDYYDGYYPYMGSSFYMGYDPFWYNRFYFPLIISFNFRNRWHNDYYGWNNHNHGGNSMLAEHSGNAIHSSQARRNTTVQERRTYGQPQASGRRIPAYSGNRSNSVRSLSASARSSSASGSRNFATAVRNSSAGRASGSATFGRSSTGRR
jgi:hypothetical protein